MIGIMKKIKVVISGGGTGGHIFPALAIARELEKKIKNIDILFVGAKDRMEMTKIPAEGYKIEGLWISGLPRTDSLSIVSLFDGFFTFPFQVISSLLKARKIIKRFKPDIAIGTGGYASWPLLYVAAKKKIPTLIQEQNSYPGITNRILSKVVNKVCVAYENMQQFFPKQKIIFTGNPIRQDVLEFGHKKKSASEYFNLDKSKKTILVIGGSLGARTINQVIDKNIDFFAKNNLNLIWQTGVDYKEAAEKRVSENLVKGINAFTFIKEMDLAYAEADIIISRAGAIAISELCCIGKPVILIPSPNVSENHQYKNAQSLVNKNAALLVEDDQASRKLVSQLLCLLNDKEMQNTLKKNIEKLGIKDAAGHIVEICLEILNYEYK